MIKWKLVREDFEPASHWVADLGIIGQADIWRQWPEGGGPIKSLTVILNGTVIAHLPPELWDRHEALFRYATEMVGIKLIQAVYDLKYQ